MATLSLQNELTPNDRKAFDEAKKLVQWAESRHPGNPNGVSAELMKYKPEFHQNLSGDEIHKMRVAEIAQQYQKVSDGAGGIARDASKQSMNSLTNVLEGKHPSGQGMSFSQSSALQMNKTEHLSTANLSRLGKAGGIMARVSVGILGAGAAGFAAAAEPDATVGSVAKATVNAAVENVLPGATEARQGHMCKAFGEAAGAMAEGGATGVTLTAGVTVAAGTSWSGVGLVGGAAIAASAPIVGQAAGNVGRQAGEAACEAVVGVANKVSGKIADFRDNAASVVDSGLDRIEQATNTMKRSVSASLNFM
ncbi:MAG: hypothetical protein RBR86_06550 [Pseudobdellovibrionaceae bacterium]|jgi:hypothetical protein|nr:hypothetical protein [Pseudobdellovibrionaceae bacterium]